MADMTPAKWLDVLDKRLTARWAAMRIYQEFFDGEHPLAFATNGYRQEFEALLRGIQDNWCPLVVSSSVERLQVQGFRFGTEQAADADAWAIWQANRLDAEANMAHTEAVKLGMAYWLVAPPAGRDDAPRITAEHPSQMIVAHEPGNRYRLRSALKRWVDEDDGYVYATLYLPDRIWKVRSQRKTNNGRVEGQITWEPRRGDEGGANPLGVVPAVPILNAPTLLGGGESDLKIGIPIQRAIDKEIADMIVTSEFAAYRQRIMTGVETAYYPDNYEVVELRGKPIKIEGGVARLLTVEDEKARVYDLPASDLKNYVQAIEMLVQHLAAQTKTPPHYLLGDIVNASGDALKASEAGLTSKVRDKMLSFGDAHEDAMRLAFRAIGDTERASAMDAETLWADPETRSFAQTVDGAVKLKELGIPDEALWEEIGWSPQRIRRVKTMQTAADLLRFADAPDPATPAPDREAA